LDEVTDPKDVKADENLFNDKADNHFNIKKGYVDSDDIIYGDSMKELKDNYHYLKRELQKAEDDNDLSRIDLIKKQLNDFNKQLATYFTKDKKSRRFINDTIKAKNRLSKRIERALNFIKKYDENTYRHFYNALRPINSFLQSYIPDRNIDWHTE
jgi:DNA repair exonuclease SbcCD ATPase subunit